MIICMKISAAVGEDCDSELLSLWLTDWLNGWLLFHSSTNNIHFSPPCFSLFFLPEDLKMPRTDTHTHTFVAVFSFCPLLSMNNIHKHSPVQIQHCHYRQRSVTLNINSLLQGNWKSWTLPGPAHYCIREGGIRYLVIGGQMNLHWFLCCSCTGTFRGPEGPGWPYIELNWSHMTTKCIQCIQ